MSSLERESRGPSEEVARLVREEPELAVLGSSLAIVEAPAWVETATWVIADDEGYFQPIYPGEARSRIELVKAFALRHETSLAVTESDCGPEAGDHNCWESMQQLDMVGVEPTQENSGVIQVMFCEQCGQRYYRNYVAATVSDRKNELYATGSGSDVDSEDV